MTNHEKEMLIDSKILINPKLLINPKTTKIINWNDFKHCEEIQIDCFCKAIDDNGDRGLQVIARIPKDEMYCKLLECLINNQRPSDLKIIIT